MTIQRKGKKGDGYEITHQDHKEKNPPLHMKLASSGTHLPPWPPAKKFCA